MSAETDATHAPVALPCAEESYEGRTICSELGLVTRADFLSKIAYRRHFGERVLGCQG